MNNELIVSQYQKLKEEQLERIKSRDNLILVQLGAVGTIISFILSKDNADRPLIEFGYLLIPWISSVLAWLYYTQDEKIREIKAFLVAEQQKGIYGDCSWELQKSRGGRVRLLAAVDFIIFLLPSYLALWRLFYVVRESKPGMTILLWVLWGICAVIALFTTCLMKLSYWPNAKNAPEAPPAEPDKFKSKLSKRV